MIKELLVPMTGTASDTAALAAASVLAEHQGAHVAVLVTSELAAPLPLYWGVIPPSVYIDLYEKAQHREDAHAAQAVQQLAGAAISSEVRRSGLSYLPSESIAAVHARHADLSVIGCATRIEDRPRVEDLFAGLLLESGRPVLAVPAGATLALPMRRAVIAWRASREAARAVHDALPLLREAQVVDVLAIEPRPSQLGYGELPGADIAAHLARHGLQVRVVEQPRAGGTVGAAILRHVAQCDAQLLVAGGFGHSRLREKMLGGVTRELLASATVPVLFSH